MIYYIVRQSADAMVIRRIGTQQPGILLSLTRDNAAGYRGANETRMNYTILYGINLCELQHLRQRSRILALVSWSSFISTSTAVSPFSLRYAKHTEKRKGRGEKWRQKEDIIRSFKNLINFLFLRRYCRPGTCKAPTPGTVKNIYLHNI